MVNPKEILTLLGIPAEKVEHFDFVEGINEPSKIMLTLLESRTSCPHCGSSDVVVHGYYKTNINNSIIKANKLYVEVDVRRYKCKKCGKTFKTNYSFYYKNKHISRAVDIALKEDLKQMTTYTNLARQYDVSTNYVIKLFDSLPRQKRLPLPSVICVDEFHFSNAKNKKCKFPFVMSNPFTGEIIEIIESRTRDYLWSYFIRLSIQERSKVKYYVSDMNETYRSLKKAFFPNSIHIIDHFHIVKLFSTAIQKVRTRIMKNEEYDSKEYLFLKRNWKLFLSERSKLRKYRKINKRTGEVYDFETLIDATLNKYNDLYYVYWTREEFCKYVKSLHYYMETREMMTFFVKKFTHSEIKEVQEIGFTISRWFEEIVNSYAKNTTGFVLTNAIAEANNDNIQTLVDISYGLGNFERLRNRILYINRNKEN